MNLLKIQILALLLCFGKSTQAQSSVSVIFDIDLTNTSEVKIETFRFYASNFQIGFTDGTREKINVTCHLIDMEDKESLHIKIPTTSNKTIQSINYLIGTDSLTNISGALDGDLDPIKGMYWAWNSGYINFKLEGNRIVSGKKAPFEYHIGGYNGDQATSRKKSITLIESENDSIYINVNPFIFIESAESVNEFSIMIPGEKAAQLADFLPDIFTN
jgi:hypothetical protein